MRKRHNVARFDPVVNPRWVHCLLRLFRRASVTQFPLAQVPGCPKDEKQRPATEVAKLMETKYGDASPGYIRFMSRIAWH